MALAKGSGAGALGVGGMRGIGGFLAVERFGGAESSEIHEGQERRRLVLSSIGPKVHRESVDGDCSGCFVPL